MQQTREDMSNMVRKFPEQYSTYFNSKEDDAKLISVVTQPFWQSMRLSKKRLDSKDVKMKLNIVEESKKSLLTDSNLDVSKDGNHLVGTCSRALQVERVFYKGDKKIYAKKESEIGVMSMMRSNMEGGKVACPNCGFVEKVESFIDGCDACGSKFEVQDFETKVSGYALEENAGKKLAKTAKTTFLALGLLVGMLVAGAFIGILVAIVRLQMGYNDGYAVFAVMGLPIAIDIVPICMGCIFSLPIVYLVLRAKWIRKYDSRYTNEDVVKSVIPVFSAEDFCQNLEYKLRNIHMANDVDEVKTFAKCSLQTVVEGYQDVVDCNVSHVRFLHATRMADEYFIQVEVLLKLYICKGHRIRVRYEKLVLDVYGSEQVAWKKSATLREYKCNNCNRSIDILEGSTCQYCGTVFDYSHYGWMISNYEIRKNKADMYRWTRTVLAGGYLLIFALSVLIHGMATDSGIFILYKMIASNKVTDDTCEDVRIICEEAIVATDGKQEIIDRAEHELDFEYPTSNVHTVAAECAKQMTHKGYVLVEEWENSYVFYRYEKAGEGDIRITFSKNQDSIGVSIEPLVSFHYEHHS